MHQDDANAPLIVPKHIGIIADGNRRWARQHGLPAYEGHLAGYNALKEVVFKAFDEKIEYVSLYLFSTENWQRSSQEVGKIMQLLLSLFKSDLKEYIRRGIRLRVLGVRDGLSDKVAAALDDAERQTAHLTNGTIALCFNYGGRREVLDAAKAMFIEAEQKGIAIDALDEDDLARHLYAPDMPPLDMIVRTSGEQRLSNFMLWRGAYSELLFIDTLLPDIRVEHLDLIVHEFNLRGRRFGS